MMKEIDRDELFKWEIENTDSMGDYLDDDFDMGCHCGAGVAVDNFFEKVMPKNNDMLDKIAAWYKWAVNKSNDVYFMERFITANKLDPYFYYPEQDLPIGMSLVLQSFCHAVREGDMDKYDKELEEYLTKVEEYKKNGVYGEDEEDEDL